MRTPRASRLWLLQHRGCTEQPALGHGAPSARRERGHPPLLLPSRAHLTGMRHSRKSRVATLRQSSTPWLCSHFSTAMSVAGEGCTTSRSCSTLRYFPAGTTGSTRGAERGEAGGVGGGRRRAHSRYRTAGSAARTRRGRGGSDARCRAAGAPGSAARRARGSRGRRGPIRGEGCGRAVSGGSAGGDTAPTRSSQDGTYRNGWSRSSARPAAQQLQAAAHSASTAGSARHLRRAELSGADRGPTLRSPPPPSRPRAPLPPRHPATAPGHVRERMSPGHVRKRRSRDGRTPSPPTAALRGAALRGSARVAMAVAERRPTRPSPWLGCRRYGCARPHGAGLKAARMGLGGPWRG